MSPEITSDKAGNALFKICSVEPSDSSPDSDAYLKSKYVLADYHFKIPLTHLKFLSEVFSEIETQLMQESGSRKNVFPWQTYWLSKVFAIRVMQFHEIHKKQGKYALNNTYRLYLNRLFINSVCWYMEKYSLFPSALPEKSTEFASFAYCESSLLLDSNFSYSDLLNGKERVNNLLSEIGAQSREIPEWELFASLIEAFSSICIETVVSSGKTSRLPQMDPKLMKIAFARQTQRQQLGEMSPYVSVLSENSAEQKMVVNGH